MWVKMYIMIKRNVKLNIYFTDQGENRPRSGGGVEAELQLCVKNIHGYIKKVIRAQVGFMLLVRPAYAVMLLIKSLDIL
jgi:hypothetical protein